MYFELYVDVLFLVNFLMDYLLLLLVWRILKCKSNHGRIVIGALIGSVLTCIAIILPIPNRFLEFLLFHLGVNTCMIRVGFKIKKGSLFLQALILLYIGAFFMGGIMEVFQQYVKIGSLFLFLTIVGYYMTLGMWKFIIQLQNWSRVRVQVTVILGDNKIEAKGLVDTGNMLRDSETDLPVSVISDVLAKVLLDGKSVEYRYIPYQSIGKKNGVIPIFFADEMKITGEKECLIKRPVFGIANGEFEIILSPNLF